MIEQQTDTAVELARGHYVRIATAKVLRFNDRAEVTSPTAYLAWVTEQLLEKGDQARPWACDLPVAARIEHGRWIADCVNCLTLAPFTHPEWQLACCAECGCVMRKVIVPGDFRAIEAILLLRPQRVTQNWRAPETIAELTIENLSNGVAIPCPH